ncbi:hypothetical protein [Streptomyces mirabilis]|uniref:hypothetical protein n=1 Tax=Streptomyces mirabilis TaxID=68239 RepID=UPI0036C56B0C
MPSAAVVEGWLRRGEVRGEEVLASVLGALRQRVLDLRTGSDGRMPRAEVMWRAVRALKDEGLLPEDAGWTVDQQAANGWANSYWLVVGELPDRRCCRSCWGR